MDRKRFVKPKLSRTGRSRGGNEKVDRRRAKLELHGTKDRVAELDIEKDESVLQFIEFANNGGPKPRLMEEVPKAKF